MTDQFNVNLANLLECFPDVDPEVCESVLRANAGSLEPSVNTLLAMSDPNYKPEPTAPSIPEEPSLPVSSLPLNQPDNDYQLAVALAEEEQRRTSPAIQSNNSGTSRMYSMPNQKFSENKSHWNDLYYGDDFPFKEKISAFTETTKKKLKNWYDQFKAKNFDSPANSQTAPPMRTHETDDEFYLSRPSQSLPPSSLPSNVNDPPPLPRPVIRETTIRPLSESFLEQEEKNATEDPFLIDLDDEPLQRIRPIQPAKPVNDQKDPFEDTPNSNPTHL